MSHLLVVETSVDQFVEELLGGGIPVAEVSVAPVWVTAPEISDAEEAATVYLG